MHEEKQQDRCIANRQATIQQIRRTLQEIVGKVDNLNDVKSAIVQLFQVHVLNDGSSSGVETAVSNPQKVRCL